MVHTASMHINRAALKAIRVRSDISLAELARRSEIDRTLISRIESGDRKGNAGQLRALAAGLGVPVMAITLYDSPEAGEAAA